MRETVKSRGCQGCDKAKRRCRCEMDDEVNEDTSMGSTGGDGKLIQMKV